MSKIILQAKPVESDDFKKTKLQIPKTNIKPISTNTKGRKILTLWGANT